MGLLSLGLAKQKTLNPTYLCLAAMGISMTLFILIPPTGFLTNEVASYVNLLHVKRMFIFGYYAVFPWFLYYFSERPGKKFPQFISLFVALSYFLMFFTTSTLPRPLWTYFAIGVFGLNFSYGVMAARWLHRKGDQNEARWLSMAMIIFGMLFLLASLNHILLSFTNTNLFGLTRFFPMHLHSLAFMLIMGLRLQSIARNKSKLELQVNRQDHRWHSLIHNSPVIYMELDTNGNIRSVNSFAGTQLNLVNKESLVGKDWFECFVTSEESDKMRLAFHQSIVKADSFPPFKGVFKGDKGGLVSVNWMNLNTYGPSGELEGIAMVGQDITKQEDTIVELNRLRQEIEMENINLHKIPVHQPSHRIIGTSKALGLCPAESKPGRLHQCHGAIRGRDRCRQGAVCRSHSCLQPAM